jgi:spore coat protein U-like protein
MKKINKILFASLLTVSSVSMFAASNGTKGDTSQGNSQINASVSNKIIIDDLSDIDFGEFDPGNAPGEQTMVFCVGMNKSPASRLYDITASSANADGTAFRMLLSGGNSANEDEVIPYTVSLTDANAATESLESGVLKNNGTNGFKTAANLGCNVQDQTLAFNVVADTSTKLGGSYADTLTLLVSPL